MELQQHNHYLILRYLNTGSDNETESFADGENISADIQ